MHTLHVQLLEKIKKHAGKGTAHSAKDSYLSSGHYYYSVSVPQKREIAKRWLTTHRGIEVEELLELLESLLNGKSYEERTMAGILLGYLSKQRKQLDPMLLDGWLNNLVGWAEIDTFCQSTFSGKELLDNWETWESLIRKFSKDKNISKRRASLVLLTSPVTNSDDKKLEKLAFEVINTLKTERDILITKAISWLLRSLVKLHKKNVKTYVEINKDVLPNIAVRETMRKIKTGRK